MADTQSSFTEHIPAMIPYNKVNELWIEYQKTFKIAPNTFSDTPTLPPNMEDISVNSNPYVTDIRMIRQIFSIMNESKINESSHTIGDMIQNQKKTQIELFESGKQTREESTQHIIEYISEIAKVVLEEILVKDLTPLQTTFIDSICRKEHPGIPTWKIDLGNLFTEMIKSTVMKELLSPETIKQMTEHYMDIKYENDSQVPCAQNIKSEYNKWYESITRLIILITRLTRPPKAEYFYIALNAICIIIDKIYEYMSSEQYSAYQNTQMKFIMTDVLRKIMKNSDLMSKNKYHNKAVALEKLHTSLNRIKDNEQFIHESSRNAILSMYVEN